MAEPTGVVVTSRRVVGALLIGIVAAIPITAVVNETAYDGLLMLVLFAAMFFFAALYMAIDLLAEEVRSMGELAIGLLTIAVVVTAAAGLLLVTQVFFGPVAPGQPLLSFTLILLAGVLLVIMSPVGAAWLARHLLERLRHPRAETRN